MPSRRRPSSRRPRRTNGYKSITSAPTHTIHRTVVRTLAQIATDQGYVWDLRASADISDWADIANVFDQYRVKHIELTWTLPRSDAAEYPTLYYAPDWNDSAIAPANRAAVLNYETCVVHQFAENRRTHTFKFVPSLQTSLPGGADAAVVANQWAHTSQNPAWLGVKSFITQYNSTSNASALIEVHAKVCLEFKNSR